MSAPSSTAIRLYILISAAVVVMVYPKAGFGQALTMDGESGIFFQPWANVVPAEARKSNSPTLSFHAVDAGPVAGSYINISVEEGFGNRLELGYTFASHTDGGDPNFSPLFNYAGMSVFNAKVKLIDGNHGHHSWIPAVALGGVLRTGDPYVSQYFAHTNAVNGDLYGVATKVFTIRRIFMLLISGGVRGTNAEVYGYGGNATHWQARAFGAVGFPFSVRNLIITPAIEIDQEPNHLAYFAAASILTTLIYALRLSRRPDQKWSIDVGTGHVANKVAPGVRLKIDNALALAFDYRY